MPQSLQDDNIDLVSCFAPHNLDIYYSLYSLDPLWRRKWIPKAMEPECALERLTEWASYSRCIPVIHHALIAGENDSLEEASNIAALIRSFGLRADINLVRYNPFSDLFGEESSIEQMQAVADVYAQSLPGTRVQIVGRVGHDVKASCGMFVTDGMKRQPEQEAKASTPSLFVRAE